MPKETIVLSFSYEYGLHLHVYLLEDKTYRVYRLETVSPFPDSWSLENILENEEKERNNGKIVYRDAWKTDETYCDSLQEVLDMLGQETSNLTDLYPFHISEEYKQKLKDHINLADESGECIKYWRQKLHNN